MSAPHTGPHAVGRFWHSLGRQGVGYLVGEAGAKGGIYLLLIAVAPLVGVRDFGFFNLFLSLLGLLVAAVGLGLPEAVLAFYFQSDDARRELGAVWTLVSCAGVVAVALAWLLRRSLAGSLGVPELLVPAAALGAALAALRQSWLGLLRARQRGGVYAVVRWLEPVLFAAGIGVGLTTTGVLGHVWLAASYLVALGVVAVVGTVYVLRRPGLRPGFHTAPTLLSFSLPFVFHVFAMTGLASFDQVVIQQLLGAEATGLYAFAYRFGMAMYLLSFAFTAAWSPLAMARLQDGEPGEDLRRLATTGVDLATGAAVFLVFALPPLASWIGGAEYRGGLHLLPLVVYGYLWMVLYGLAVVFLVHRRRSRSIALASGIAFAANAGLNYLLVPGFGIAAAAATTVASYVLLLCLVLWFLGPQRRHLPWRRLLLRPLLAAPAVLAALVLYGGSGVWSLW